MHGETGKEMGRSRFWAAVLGAGLVSSWTTALLMKQSRETPPPAVSAPVLDLSELNLRLDELIRALRPPSASVPQPAAGAALDRTAVEDTPAWSEVARSLQEIRGLVGRPAPQGAYRIPEAAEAGLRQLETRWEMVGELESRLDAERTATRQSLLFLTPAMVIQRYGRPTGISVDDKGVMRWWYSGGPTDQRISVSIYFKDGYVINATS